MMIARRSSSRLGEHMGSHTGCLEAARCTCGEAERRRDWEAERTPPHRLPDPLIPVLSVLLGLTACEQDTHSLEPGVLTALPSPGALGAAMALKLESPSVLRLTCQAESDAAEVHEVSSPEGNEHHFELWGLLADTRYDCTAVNPSAPDLVLGALTFTTEPLPPGLGIPEITLPATDPSQVGYLLYNHSFLYEKFYWEDPALVILDPAGQLRWYEQGIGGGDIDSLLVPGKGILFGGATPPFQTAPTLIDLTGDPSYVATSITASEYEEPGAYNHDCGLTTDGKHILTLAYEYFEDWRGFIVKEIELQHNMLTWAWSSVEDGLAQGLLQPGSMANYDPHHANAVFDREEPEGRAIYLSLAHIDQIFKIDYQTRAVKWVLGRGGDFTLLEADGTPAEEWRWFFGQHDVKRIGNQLSVYDNGVDRGYWGQPNTSRALVLTLDEAARTATITFEYTEPFWEEPFWGGYDRYDDGSGLITLSHCDTCTPNLGHPSAFILHDAAGELLWRADFPDTASALYRAERLDPCTFFTTRRYCAEGASARASVRP